MEVEGRPTLPTVIVTGVALLLQIVGLVTPGWLYMIVSYVKVHFGLWYMVTCVHSECVTSSTVEGSIGNVGQTTFAITMGTYRGLTVAGAVAGLVAMIILIVTRRSSQPTPTGRNVATFFILVSGVLAFSAAARFAAGILSAIKLYDRINQFHPYAFPYSLFITGVGGVLAIIVFFTLLCKSCSSRRNEPGVVINQPGIEMNRPPPYTVGKV